MITAKTMHSQSSALHYGGPDYGMSRDGWCAVVYAGGEWHPAGPMNGRRVYAEMDAVDCNAAHIGCYDEGRLIEVCPAKDDE